MTKDDNGDFKKSTKSLICDNGHVDNDVKDINCHITGKYTGSAQKDRNIIVKLNLKIPAVFLNLKHDSNLIMQELGRAQY